MVAIWFGQPFWSLPIPLPIQRVDQAARPKPLGKSSSVVGVWSTLMKLSLSSLLLVFLADELTKPATPSSLRCCTWSVATCTVEQFPVKRQDPKTWCQERFSVIVQTRSLRHVQNTTHQPRNGISQIFSLFFSRKRPRRVPSKKGLSLKIVIKHRPKFY